MASNFSNSTAGFLRLPSLKDLFLLPVKVGHGVGRFLNIGDAMEAPVHGGPIAQMGMAADAVAEQGTGPWSEAFREVFGLHNIRSFGGMLSYMTSRWAFACFSVVCSSAC